MTEVIKEDLNNEQTVREYLQAENINLTPLEIYAKNIKLDEKITEEVRGIIFELLKMH